MILHAMRRSRSTRVSWTAAELGIELEHHFLDPKGGGLRSAAFLARNPMGKVPVLEDGQFVLTEAAAICRYLCRQQPDAHLLPTDPKEQAQVDRWLSFVITELEQPLWTKAKHTFALPAAVRTDLGAAIEYEWKRAADSLGPLDRTYLVGEHFTLADIFLSHTLAWAKLARMPLPDGAWDWAKTHFRRPAYLTASQLEAS